MSDPRYHPFENKTKKTIRPELIALFNKWLKYVTVILVVLLINGVFFPKDIAHFPWMLTMIIAFMIYVLVNYKYYNMLKFTIVVLQRAIYLSGFIWALQILIEAKPSSIITWMVQQETQDAVVYLCVSFLVGVLGNLFAMLHEMAGIIWAILQTAYLLYIWFGIEIKGMKLNRYLVESIVPLLTNALLEPNVFTFFTVKMFGTYIIMCLSELTWNICSWGPWLYSGVVGLCFFIGYYNGYSSFLHATFMSLAAFPCKYLLEYLGEKRRNALLFFCVSIQCLAIIEFCFQSSGLFERNVSKDSFFVHMFHGVKDGNTTYVNATCTPEKEESASYVDMISSTWKSTYNSIVTMLDSPLTRVFSRKFWSDTFAVFYFFHGLPDGNFWLAHMGLFLVKVFVNDILGITEKMAFIFGVLSPVCLFILLGKAEYILEMFQRILSFKMKPNSKKKASAHV